MHVLRLCILLDLIAIVTALSSGSAPTRKSGSTPTRKLVETERVTGDSGKRVVHVDADADAKERNPIADAESPLQMQMQKRYVEVRDKGGIETRHHEDQWLPMQPTSLSEKQFPKGLFPDRQTAATIPAPLKTEAQDGGPNDSNVVYNCLSGENAECCDIDGDCFDGDDDFCCEGKFYCSTDGKAYAEGKGGTTCDEAQANYEANKAVDCEWGDWEEWSDCDYSCGTGSQERIREIPVGKEANGNGAECVGPAQETQDCNMEDCPTTKTSTRAPVKVDVSMSVMILIICVLYWPFILCGCGLCCCTIACIVVRKKKSKDEDQAEDDGEENYGEVEPW